MPKLRILIVDDAVVVRRILTDTLSADPELEVSSAANGRIALAKLDQVNPDLITLDMEMPELDGLATLKEIRKVRPKVPVIMFSTLTARGAAVTLDALAAGANDYLTKPANVGSVAAALARVKDELIPKIKALCHIDKPRPDVMARVMPATLPPPTLPRGSRVDIVTIGVSTGGPKALSEILPLIPANFPVPIVIVQHMPPIFTKLLADRLTNQCKIPVMEGARGMPVAMGKVYIAAGGSHTTIRRQENQVVIDQNDDPPENSCKPAVDVLFRSVVRVYGANTLGVILTGMGSDGLRGCELIRHSGGQVVVQDEATSVVWGMPGFVARAGLADRQIPLGKVAAEITARAVVGRQIPSARAS